MKYSVQYETVKEKTWVLDSCDVIRALRAAVKVSPFPTTGILDHTLEVALTEDGGAIVTWRNVESREPCGDHDSECPAT